MPTQTIDDAGNANVQGPISAEITDAVSGDADIVSFVMTRVREARDVRDKNHKESWDKYERVYRGVYNSGDRTRESERSMLIAPALMQAVDSTAAAIEDAIFGRAQWFDMIDDSVDKNSQDVESARQSLLEDFDLARVPEQIAKTVLNGCIYGTGIGKINVEQWTIPVIEDSPEGPKELMTARPIVTLTAIAPWEFVIDSNARDPDSAFFSAHEFDVPQHKVWEKQQKGTYKSTPIGTFHADDGVPNSGDEDIIDASASNNLVDGAAHLTEYFGKLPKEMVSSDENFDEKAVDAGGFIECIVTIANEQHLLRARPNPFLTQDRPIIAYQHNVVPSRFYGAGVCEKGWNSQKALDAELRARMDALGLITAPMMGADITRLPRNPDMKVRPGKVWMTRGRPSEVLEPIQLGVIQPTTFNQSAEMERMVQTATGAIDSNAPLDSNRRNETASGISMIQSSALKRMRRTMWNLERQFLNPFVRKAYLRYMQFNPTRYPKDFEFGVKGTMGIVAREFEQSNLTALLSVLSPDHASYQVILSGVIELSGTPKRDEMLAAMAEASKPNPEQEKKQKLMEEMQMKSMVLEMALKEAEVEKMEADIELVKEKTRHERINADLEDEKIDIQALNAITGRDKTRAAFGQVAVAKDKNEVQREGNREKSKDSKGK